MQASLHHLGHHQRGQGTPLAVPLDWDTVLWCLSLPSLCLIPVLLESSLGWSAVYRPFPKSLLTPPCSAPGNSLLLPFKDVFLPVWTVSLSLVCLLEPDLTMSPNYTCRLLSPASSNLFPTVDSDSIKPGLHMVLKWSHPPQIAWICKVIFSAVGRHLIWFSLVDFCE